MIHHLDNAGVVPKIQENNAAMVTPTMHPAAERNLLTYLGIADFATEVTTHLVASCFGVWILIGPSEAATWGGLGAIIGYGLGQALPFLAFITIGKRMRKIMPNGNTLTQFVLIRFGKAMFRLVLLLTIMYMFVYLAAEVTAIAKVVNLMSGFPLWQTSLIIIMTTLAYTLYGGLRASIFTDKIQFIIIMILLVFAINHIFILVIILFQ